MRKGDLLTYELGYKKMALYYMDSGQLVSEHFAFGAAEDPEHDFSMGITAQFTDQIAYVLTLWNRHDKAKSVTIDIPVSYVTDELELMARHQRYSPTPIPMARYHMFVQPKPGLN
jgi:hypothetical protein